VQLGGRRDGTRLIAIDVEPLVSWADEPESLDGARDIYLLGVAHRGCLHRAEQLLRARQVELPDDLPQLVMDDEVESLPELHLPPTLGQCPFCDGADPTDEHVYPQWLSKELGAIGQLVDRRAPRGPRRLRTIDLTAPICGACNNRWLSVLENDTKPILAPMVRGEDRRLDLDEQRLLATWALKTAMMFDLASGSPVIPAGFFQALRQRRQPLESKFVWIAGYHGSLAAWAQHTPLRLGIADDQPPNAFVTTFTTFHVVFQVIGHFTRGGMDFKDDRIYKDVLAQIWPPRLEVVDWPPQQVAFNDEWLETLAASIK
jgi:hypothetical protein